MFMIPLLLLSLTFSTASHEQLTDATPNLFFFTVNDCSDCDIAKRAWDQLIQIEPPGIKLVEVNCDVDDRTCHDHQISKLPSVLFVANNGLREFQEDYSVDTLMEFVDNSIKVLLHGEDLLNKEDAELLYLDDSNMDVLGKSHALVYLMYDEEKEHVEDFVLSLKAHLAAEFALPAYIIDCDKMSHICVAPPFSVQLLPCIKFLGEQVYTYTGDYLVERLEYWLQVQVFKTREPDVDMSVETITEDREDSRLVYLTSESEHANIAYMEGALLAFYLTDESTELEDMFKLLSKKYRDTKDLQIFAINCDEYNAPKACRDMPNLPTVKHGFMGRLAKEISFTTEQQYDDHIVKLLNIIAEGGHILRRNLGKIFELTISNIGEQIHRYDVTFVYYYSSACGRCPECDKVWGDIHLLYANHPLILPGRVDCNFNRGTCKQADTRGSEIAVYYKGVYHSKYSGTFKYGPIVKFLEKMYKSPPPGVFVVEPEDRYIDRKKRRTKDEEKEATVDVTPEGEKVDESSDFPERSGHALIVTTENFNYTLSNNKLVFLKFFVPWCGHCQKLKPTWKLLAQSFRDVTDIVIGMINCQNEEHLCKKHMVYGYPTMFTFIDGKQTYRYREERTLNNLIDHVKEKYYTAIEDDLKYSTKPFTITAQNVWNVLGVRKYTMILFTAEQCNACHMNQHFFEETWKAVKSQTLLNDKLMLATVYCQKDLDLCKEMEVTQVPYIVLYNIDERIDPGAAPTEPLLHPFLSVVTHINSSPNHLSLDVIAWQKKSNDMRAEIEEEKAREKRAAEASEKSFRPKATPKTEAITELGEDNFKAQLKKSRFTLVKFYAPWCGHCRKLAPIWTEIGEKYINQPDVVIAKVNCDANEKLCDKHKVNVYPALFMFENDKKLKHACKRRKKEDIMQFIDKFLKTIPADERGPVPAPEEEQLTGKKLKGVQGAVWQLDKEDMLLLLENKKNDFLFVLYYHGSDKKSMHKLSETWNRIATMYLNDPRLTMGQVDCDIEPNLCLRYQSNTRKDYPQIFLYDKEFNVSFECLKRGEAPLIEFIESHMEKKSKGEETITKDEL